SLGDHSCACSQFSPIVSVTADGTMSRRKTGFIRKPRLTRSETRGRPSRRDMPDGSGKRYAEARHESTDQ
ncbi:MAG: hypothetical protein AAGA95_14095, partial [Pseudomonadota bacterium]